MATSPLAPDPEFSETADRAYEQRTAPNTARKGPLRFQEGIVTDTDVPNEFSRGVTQGYVTPPGRPNQNSNVFEKPAEETTRERAHMGSASWVEAPTYLGAFAGGAGPEAEQRFIRDTRNGGRYERRNYARID
ncbi:hypothetical protein [Streptomyces sp. CBMA29]|uniref:hypothetical protein n=1 Tax=Streptomyces sp. CBMA29 TaxID=1896314 RepID=UPI00166200B7|nr:hypothetical protein [Streptomyces sp. CBMA29]MBD0734050.1 hypothetical protein [Streptomyces sp. CBMA29]